MQDRYLEITFRKGKAVAAYLYLSGTIGMTCTRSQRIIPGIVADFDENSNVIGLEITSPEQIQGSQVNEVLHTLHVSPISAEELAPLKAA